MTGAGAGAGLGAELLPPAAGEDAVDDDEATEDITCEGDDGDATLPLAFPPPSLNLSLNGPGAGGGGGGAAAVGWPLAGDSTDDESPIVGARETREERTGQEAKPARARSPSLAHTTTSGQIVKVLFSGTLRSCTVYRSPV